jgi:hypothetical protein
MWRKITRCLCSTRIVGHVSLVQHVPHSTVVVKERSMKRLSLFSAALLLAGSSAALAATPTVQFVARQADPAPMNEAAGDAPATEAAPEAAPAPAVYGQLPLSSALSGGSCGCGAGLANCCERQYSPLDGVWDNYCAERAPCHPISGLFALLHVESHHGCGCGAPVACGAPVCNSQERFGLPQLRMPKCLTAASSCGKGCGTGHCSTCAPARPRLLGTYHQKGCAKCGVPHACNGATSPEGDPGLNPPPPVAPPADSDAQPSESGDDMAPPAAPELPPPVPTQSEARGWLPLPRLMRLPR